MPLRTIALPVDELSEFDVVVVGAGILGISSAYHIQKSGPDRRVLVIDRFGDAGQANTGRSNAMFRNTFSSTDNQILANSSIDFYLHVQRELGTDIGADAIGYMWLMSDGQLSASEGFLEKMAGNGVDFRRYSEAELRQAIPGLETRQDSDEGRLMSLENVDCGIFGPKCGRLAPEKLVWFYRDALREMGCQFMFNQEVKQLLVEAKDGLGLEGEPFVWQDSRVAGVRLGDGKEVRAKMVVVAGGAWNNELLDPAGIDGHVKAKKRQLFAIPARGVPFLQELLFTGGFNDSGTLPFVILPRSGLFVKPVKESGEFWIGCEDEVNREYITFPEHDLESYRAEPEYYEHNVHQLLREYLPQFEGARPSRMWAGLYAYNTLDNMPYVFEQDGLIVVGGDSGSGVMKGDSLGRVVDSVYRDGWDAETQLYGGAHYRASKLSFRHRDVEREEWVL
jgi:FAD-dependent oxidoreductase domain-containing protein 1